MKDELQAYFDEWEQVLPQDAREALREVLRLRNTVTVPRSSGGFHRFDLNPAAQEESAITQKLVEMGWTPPGGVRAPVADEQAALTHQDIYDRFQFLEGLVNEQRYKQIAETAIAIYESGAPWAAMADTIRDLRAELGYVAQYGKRELPNMCPPATSRDRWMYEQGRLAERAALASAPVAPQQCQTDVCQAAKADGVLCANDECDRANGVRPVSAPIAGEATDADIWRIAQMPECHHGGDFSHSVDPIPFARALLSRYAAPQASEEDTYTDENGTVWNRPTAWAYAQVCRARDKWQTVAQQPSLAPAPEVAGPAVAAGRDAERWRKFVRVLAAGHIPGPGYGTRLKLITVGPMFGEEHSATTQWLTDTLDKVKL